MGDASNDHQTLKINKNSKVSHPSAAAATASASSTAAHGHVLSADGLLDVDVTTSELVVALKS